MNFNPSKIAENFILNKLKSIKGGSLSLKNYNQETKFFGEDNGNVKADITVNNPKFYLNILKGGSTGLAECYVRDEFTTSDLTSLIELTARNIILTHRFSGILKIKFLKNLFKNIFASNTKNKSKEHISKHYDLGNEFFSIWLDKTLTYSSAIYEKPTDNLSNAQINKYNKLIDFIKPKPGDKVLEVGCGWGGFAEHLAKNYDVKLDCITISKKQLEFAKKRIFNAGLNEKVNIKIKEGDKERVQAFQGVCIAKKNNGLNSSFSVRKISSGEGVERVFPLYSNIIESIERVKAGDVRRAKLYYLRNLSGKKARIAERTDGRSYDDSQYEPTAEVIEPKIAVEAVEVSTDTVLENASEPMQETSTVNSTPEVAVVEDTEAK